MPAIKEAADAFGKQKHIQIVVTGSPEPKWLYDAQQNADLIFSGSEDMMNDFQVAMHGALDPTTITPLYPSLADIVSIDVAHRICRDCGIGLTIQGRSRLEAREFIGFLQSPQGAQIFRKWGWSVQP